MLKRLLLAGLLGAFSFSLSAQTNEEDLRPRDTVSEITYSEDMERNYDELLSQWAGKMRFSADCSSMDDALVSVEDSVYIHRLYSLPSKMELAFNPAVRSCIERYAGRLRNQVSYMLGLGEYYFPMFKDALDREGLPLELKYLPVIESALNSSIKSRAGAMGLWQFMPSTGRMYNLEINSLVDERCDPQKATDAAVKYLKDLYVIYGDWNLVIAAYNCGPKNVNKAIRYSGGATDYWTIYPHLPKETRGYVPIFIAATYIMNYYKEHNICPAVCQMPPSMDSLAINKNVHFGQIAENLNISIEDIRLYNPQFKEDIIPGSYKTYFINLPIDKTTAFIDKKDEIYNYKVDQFLTHRKVAGVSVTSAAATTTHKVRRGETLASLAKVYGVTSSQIKQWNRLSSNTLVAGRKLKIYKPVKTVEKAEEKNTESLASNTTTQGSDTILVSSSGRTRVVSVPKTTTTLYRVVKGDSWTSVAKKNNASVADIKKWNNIKNNRLSAGKDLKIEKIEYIEEEVPQTEPQIQIVSADSSHSVGLMDGYLKKLGREDLPLIRMYTDSEEDRKTRDDTKIIYHKVKIGETISKIAERYSVTTKEIILWNKLSSSVAKIGQRLLIILPDKKEENSADTKSQTDAQPYEKGN